MWDVIIIGAGAVGACLARELSKYGLSLLVLEKAYDVGDGASMANSGIVHSGYDPLPGSNKAFHNVPYVAILTSLLGKSGRLPSPATKRA